MCLAAHTGLTALCSTAPSSLAQHTQAKGSGRPRLSLSVRLRRHIMVKLSQAPCLKNVIHIWLLVNCTAIR